MATGGGKEDAIAGASQARAGQSSSWTWPWNIAVENPELVGRALVFGDSYGYYMELAQGQVAPWKQYAMVGPSRAPAYRNGMLVSTGTVTVGIAPDWGNGSNVVEYIATETVAWWNRQLQRNPVTLKYVGTQKADITFVPNMQRLLCAGSEIQCYCGQAEKDGSGNIWLAPNFPVTVTGPENYLAYGRTFAHEVGHMLGLDHWPGQVPYLMNETHLRPEGVPSDGCDRIAIYAITSAEIAGIRQHFYYLYGQQ